MSHNIRIPSNVDREDRVLANFTARQVLILSVTGLLLYSLWSVTRSFVPLAGYLVVAIPLGATAATLVLGRRDGLPLDRLLLAALRQRLGPRHRVAAPEGIRPAPTWLSSRTDGEHAADSAADIAPAPLRLPADGVTEAGVVDLGLDGVAAILAVSTINFQLRTPAEQEGLVASFARYLHSLTAPIQVLIRTARLDLSGQIAELRENAGGLPHPALEHAAREHADYLTQLGTTTTLLRRQVLLVVREPLRSTPGSDALTRHSPLAAILAKRKTRNRAEPVSEATRQAAESRLARRLAEASEMLAATGLAVTPLDAGAATAVLAACCKPDSLIPPSAELAGADEVITTAPTGDTWPDPAADQPAHEGREHP
ncbi:PrgI family protein [Prauserella muralis]|uniref:Uncharacterized protein n=1 Tax=Prauserella muralis TaxID=588067 RepID=A0A2V4AVI0_9PSEU|nr:PrgI family protein [Prauserella muralis]PXY25450.1 hypothetical protein BAY60_18935 [Prauserella muralis]TWE27576.1 PrgI family protein [Prauserella muralis]